MTDLQSQMSQTQPTDRRRRLQLPPLTETLAATAEQSTRPQSVAIAKKKSTFRIPEQTRPQSSPSAAFFDKSAVKKYAGLSIQVPSTSTSDATAGNYAGLSKTQVSSTSTSDETLVYTHPESFIETPRRNHGPERDASQKDTLSANPPGAAAAAATTIPTTA